jgi:hypothetical protein
MKNRFSFSRNQTIVLATLFFVLIIGAIYFFIYVPNNQNELEAQRFRCLQNIEINIQSKVDNSIALLNNILNTYNVNHPLYNREKLNKYLEHYPRKNFILEPVKPVQETEDKNKVNTSTDSLCKVEFDNRRLTIHLQKGGYFIHMRYTLKQFIDPLLTNEIFDQYIFLRQKNIIYQTFPSGITTIVPDSLKSDKSAFLEGQVKNIHLSGNDYKIFSQRLNINADSVITVSGLLTTKNYQQERNKLPENIVLLLLTIAAAAILALPWLKLYQMGNKDRLTAADGIFSFAVSMLLVSLLFFAFFKYNSPFKTEYRKSRISRYIADSLKYRFGIEVAKAYHILDKADLLMNDQTTIATTNNPGENVTSNIYDQDNRVVFPDIQNKLKQLTKDLNMNQIYWLDNKGTEVKGWYTKSEPAPPGNYAYRDYFIKLRDHRPFYLNNDPVKPYYFEQVVSWTSGAFTSILSKPSINKNSPYVAISINLTSLDHAILPAGYLYCIINNQGRVLYHINPAKNLNQNLFEELSDYQSLKASIDAHTDKYFETRYSGKQYIAYASPIHGLPYYLVILEDKSFKNIRDINNFSFSFSMLFAFFCIIAMILTAVFLFSIKKIYYKKQYFDISWIGPNDCFHQQYNLAVFCNLITIALLIIWCNYTSFLQSFFILLVSGTAAILFINYLYSAYYKKNNPELYKQKRNASIALSVIIGLINVTTSILTEVVPLLTYEVTLFILLILTRKIHTVLCEKDLIKKLKIWNFSTSYSLMTFTRIIITSGLPVALFYTSAFNYETKLIARYRHTQFIKNIIAQNPLLLNNYPHNNIYRDSIWINTYNIVSKKPYREKFVDNYHATTLFNQLTIDKENLIPGIKELYHFPPDSLWTYTALFTKGENYTDYKRSANSYLVVKSDTIQYSLPGITMDRKWYLGITYWSCFLCSLLLFWFVFHHILRKLFALNLPNETYWENIDNLLLTDNQLNSLLFIIGSPGSGKLDRVMSLIHEKKIKGKDDSTIAYPVGETSNNCLIADMIHIPNDENNMGAQIEWNNLKAAVKDARYSLIIVNHFEYDIKNPATNRLKLNFLEDLMQRNSAKVFIISTVHPVDFLDSLNDLEKYKDEEKRLPEHDLERWHVLLGHFKIVIKKLDPGNLKIEEDMPLWEKTILYETNNGHFFKKLQQPIINQLKTDSKGKMPPDSDALSFKLGITAHYFYMYMWQSLTKEEKFLLYDLAQDGLVNPFDEYNLTLLLSKGLIVQEGCVLKLFNRGFRYFILTAIGNSEAMKIKNQIKDNGNWNKLKTPVLILIIAVLAFLFASQQEAYSTLIKYLTVITVGIPTVLKLFSFFDNTAPKSP